MKKRTTWKEIQHIVRGVNQCEVGAITIVEALLISTSIANFKDLLIVANAASLDLLDCVYGEEGDDA